MYLPLDRRGTGLVLNDSQPYFSLLSSSIYSIFKQHYFADDSRRPIFNWVHSLLGISILILGWVSALLATQLTDKVNQLFCNFCTAKVQKYVAT